jgi:peptidoglycan hydrolase CwlO-like protein
VISKLVTLELNRDIISRFKVSGSDRKLQAIEKKTIDCETSVQFISEQFESLRKKTDELNLTKNDVHKNIRSLNLEIQTFKKTNDLQCRCVTIFVLF